MNRRALLATMASAMAMAGTPSFAAGDAPRLAAIDWSMAESAAMLGVAPVAISELIGFAEVAPLAPADGTVDLGLRGSPNFEALSLIAPDLILSSSYYTSYEPRLARIAPVFSRALFVHDVPALPVATRLLAELAAQIGVPEAGARAQALAADRFAALRGQLSASAARPFLLIQIGDSRHIRIYGSDSLFGGALVELGLRNAWTAGTRFAFAAPVPMEELIAFPDAVIVITGEIPVQVAQGLGRSALWNALPAVREGRVRQLPELNGFGGVPSALRFAGLLAGALGAQG